MVFKPLLKLRISEMKNLWLLMLLFPLNVFSQNITGKIIDDQTQNGVDFATVYVNGTTIGTLSNKEGLFSLQLRGIVLPCQIVISHVSYVSRSVRIYENSDTNITIRIIARVVEIPEVSVVEKGLRRENIWHFRRVFFGNDIWGKNAILENDSVLNFKTEYFEGDSADIGLKGKLKSFTVKSSAPLKINLPLLGYDLQLDLISFTEKFDSAQNGYLLSTLGTYYYKQMAASSKSRENKYRRNRLRAYYYSPQHFTRSLFDNKLHENGYLIYRIVYSPENLRYEQNEFDPGACMVINSVTATIKGLKDNCFRIRYYCDERGFPINPDKKEYSEFKNSLICFLHDMCVIRKDGTRPGESIVFGPGIGDKRIGAMLPDNYEPGKIME
jgi:CarboxypepD_reg-like domain